MSESISQKTFEMYYNTFGNYGQHDAQHPLFVLDGELLTANEAAQKGIVTCKNEDAFSNKNIYLKRFYKLRKPVDAVVLVSCYASSRRHKGTVKVVFGKVEVEDWLNGDGARLGWIINKRYAIRECNRGSQPRIIDYKAWLQKMELLRQAEEKAKTEPNIIVTILNGFLLVHGDTYHHRQAIKLTAKACGGYAAWDPYQKAWQVKNVDADYIAQLKQALPAKTKMEVKK